jgi:translation initiation factor 2B subunit (eIF-2B alpha/beta/delta family)
MNRFDKICKDIKEVKIQGATNVAIAAIKALDIQKDKKSINKLIALRPTEPALKNGIAYALKYGVEEALRKIESQNPKISHHGAKLIKHNSVIYTHCHSSAVIGVIKSAKNKKIKVNNTETRPLFQGRRTSKDLAKLKIPNELYIDSAMRAAIKKCDIVLLGADSITKKKVINKIGSELVCETARRFRKPVYICASTWKYDRDSEHGTETPIEYRNPKEVWPQAPKNTKIINPAFEKIDPYLIRGIICEDGVFSLSKFISKAKKELK